jgi:vacuolar protein sorting-associated protein 26
MMALLSASKRFLQYLRYEWALRTCLELQITLEENNTRQYDSHKRPIYTAGERITGSVLVHSRATFPIPCEFLVVELVALISRGHGCTSQRWEVFSRSLTFPCAELSGNAMIRRPFSFCCSEFAHESYDGMRICFGYCIRLRICARADLSAPQLEHEIAVRLETAVQRSAASMSFNAGLENILHLELELDRSTYDLQDVMVGTLTFLENRIMIRRADIEIRRQETGPLLPLESDLVGSFQILEGSPRAGCVIPIRLFLKQFNGLTPTYADIYGVFSVRYILRLVVTDVYLRRFWKEHEVVLCKASPHYGPIHIDEVIHTEPNPMSQIASG